MADPASFPVLTIGPDANSLAFEQASPGYIESQMENGLRVTRSRHTWTPNIYPLKYTGLTDQDRLDLQAFYEDTVRQGALSFLFFNTQDMQTYEFKFRSFRCRFTPGVVPRIPERRWTATMQFIEAGQTHAYAMRGGRLGEGRLGY
jgi:hypothetical protein